mmetsp:Transcript_26145/g.65367  ORF Transcript_26145/g.65367 Transcript_26145/m.65367 type:complete len:141 (-) Transcript_26145:740-1162(-)
MVMVATKENDFIKMLIEALPKSNRYYGIPHTTVMLSAGPTFVSNMLRRVADTSKVFVWTLAEREMYFGDLKGKSWHSWDTQFLMFLQHNLIFILILSVPVAGYFIFKGGAQAFGGWSAAKSQTPIDDLEATEALDPQRSQ